MIHNDSTRSRVPSVGCVRSLVKKGKRKSCIDNRLDASCRARLTTLHVVGGVLKRAFGRAVRFGRQERQEHIIDTGTVVARECTGSSLAVTGKLCMFALNDLYTSNLWTSNSVDRRID